MATLDKDKMAHTFNGNSRHGRLCEKLMSICPFPSITAYWTPPPIWPRRMFCETKLSACTVSKSCWIIIAASILTYFVVMDVFLFARYRTTNLVAEAAASQPGEIYSPFTHLSVKAILSDHARHYIFTPTAEYFNTFTHFTSIFNFLTANVVSFSHLICAFISGKFVASENLLDRRIGVMLYNFRTWLDSLDGIVFRAHAGRYLQYNSVYSTTGYLVDAAFDSLGGIFLMFGVLFYLIKRFSPSRNNSLLPVWSKPTDASTDIPKTSNGHAVMSRKDMYSITALTLRSVSYGVSLVLAGICWDRTVKDFTEIFQVELKDPTLSALQFSFSHSYTSLFIFFIWRFISGQTVLNYLLLAIYMDRVWEFLQWAQWVVLLVTIPLYGVSHIYIVHIRMQLLL